MVKIAQGVMASRPSSIVYSFRATSPSPPSHKIHNGIKAGPSARDLRYIAQSGHYNRNGVMVGGNNYGKSILNRKV